MILGYYKVLCDECKWEIDEISYEPNEVDLKERNIIVYDGRTFCCEECLNAYKQRKDSENSYKVTPVKLPWEKSPWELMS